MKVTVEFKDGRVGRRHDVPPQTYIVDHPHEISGCIYGFARKHLISHDIEVHLMPVDPGIWRGAVIAGFHKAADFTVTEVLHG